MAEYYVSPTGSAANPGTIALPWDLDHALNGAGGTIQAGDTVWLRGGLYTRADVWIMETIGAIGAGVDAVGSKILWRNFPLEKVSIATTGAGQDALRIDGSFNWIWATLGRNEGIEVWRDTLERGTGRGTSIWYADTPQNGNKLIHVVARDGANGVLNGGFDPDYDYGDLELYGILSYNNGQDTSPRTHGLYLRHQGASTLLRISLCISFNQLGHGMQIYSERDDGLRNIHIEDNIIWGAGQLGTLGTTVLHNILYGGIGGNSLSPIRGGKCNRNVMFQPQGSDDAGQLHLGTSTATSEDCECQDNYMVGFSNDTTFGMVRLYSFALAGPSLSFDRNEMIPRSAGVVVETLQAGALTYTSWTLNKWYQVSSSSLWRHAGVNSTFAAWKTSTGLGVSDTADEPLPTVNKVFVKAAAKYNAGYGFACFFNYESLSEVQADLSPILTVNDQYEIYNVQDIFGEPVLSGTYLGGSVSLPTAGKNPPTPVGATPRVPPTTHPFFDAFFIRKVVPVVVPADDCVTPAFSFHSPTTPSFTPECAE